MNCKHLQQYVEEHLRVKICVCENVRSICTYLDFQNALDRIDIFLLLLICHVLGKHGKVLCWVKSYVTNRSKAVVIDGYNSHYVNISSGVPQGYLLGHYGVTPFHMMCTYICKFHTIFLMYAVSTINIMCKFMSIPSIHILYYALLSFNTLFNLTNQFTTAIK